MPNVKSPSISSNSLNFAELNRWLSTQKDHKKITVEIGKHGQCVLGTESNTVLHRLARRIRPNLRATRTSIQDKLLSRLVRVGGDIHQDLLANGEPGFGPAWGRVVDQKGLRVGDLRQHIGRIAETQRQLEEAQRHLDEKQREVEKTAMDKALLEARESIAQFQSFGTVASTVARFQSLGKASTLPGSDPLLEGLSRPSRPGGGALIKNIDGFIAALKQIGDRAVSGHSSLERHLAQKTVRALGHGASRDNFGTGYLDVTEAGNGSDRDLAKFQAAIQALETLMDGYKAAFSAPLGAIETAAFSEYASQLMPKACNDVIERTDQLLVQIVKLAATFSMPSRFVGMPRDSQLALQLLGGRLFSLVDLVIDPDQPIGAAYLLAHRGKADQKELIDAIKARKGADHMLYEAEFTDAIKAHTPKPVGADGQARPPAGPVGAEPVDPHQVLDELLASLEDQGLMAPARPPLQAPLSPLDLDALDAELDSLMKS